MEPSLFYTGLVADLYATLRSVDPDPDPYARFIERTGTPALELGCGDGDPLLALRARGLDVEGLDSSADMLERCRVRAAALGLDVVLHHAAIESMDLGRRFRSILLAGPTFNLIVDDDTAGRALRRIRAHLEPEGAALVPLFIPGEVEPGRAIPPSEHVAEDGAILRCSTLDVRRDPEARVLRASLRYERVRGAEVEVLDREWVVHWHTQDGFRDLAAAAGLRVAAVLGADGRPAARTAQQFTCILAPAEPTTSTR